MSRGEGAGSRYLKVVCRQRGCGCQVRVTRKWLELGARRGVQLPATAAWSWRIVTGQCGADPILARPVGRGGRFYA